MTSLQQQHTLTSPQQFLKLTSTTQFSHLSQQNDSPSDLRPSIIVGYSQPQSQIQLISKLSLIQGPHDTQLHEISIEQLLERCDLMISQHMGKQKGLRKRSSVNCQQQLNQLKDQGQGDHGAECCLGHRVREEEWVKEKLEMLERIRVLENEMGKGVKSSQYGKQQSKKRLGFHSQVYSLEIGLQNKQSTLQPSLIVQLQQQQPQSFYHQPTSILSPPPLHPSPFSQSPPPTQHTLLLHQLHLSSTKLCSTQQQNKYLKIQNQFLLKTKNQIEGMRREVERTKSERDLFKRKLVVMAKGNQKEEEGRGKVNGRKRVSSKAGLKERGIEEKKNRNSETLFQLSLTDAEVGGRGDSARGQDREGEEGWQEKQNGDVHVKAINNNGTHNRKPQRINLTQNLIHSND